MSAGAGAGGDFAPLEGLEDEEEDDEMDEDRDGVGMEMTLHGVDGKSVMLWLCRAKDG